MFAFLQEGLLERLTFETESALLVAFLGFFVLCAVIPYLIGSFNTAVFVSKRIYGQDIRTQGSGNGGLTNMYRVYGKKAAGLVLLGDILKTAAAILFGGILGGMRYGAGAFSGSGMCYLALTACVLGHIFPIFYKFKGGKGVLCTATGILILAPVTFAVEFLFFALILLATKYVSLSSVTVGLMLPLVLNRTMALFNNSPQELIPLYSIVLALLIFYCHRANIKRLMNRTEPRFSFKKKDNK